MALFAELYLARRAGMTARLTKVDQLGHRPTILGVFKLPPGRVERR